MAEPVRGAEGGELEVLRHLLRVEPVLGVEVSLIPDAVDGHVSQVAKS